MASGRPGTDLGRFGTLPEADEMSQTGGPGSNSKETPRATTTTTPTTTITSSVDDDADDADDDHQDDHDDDDNDQCQ